MRRPSFALAAWLLVCLLAVPQHALRADNGSAETSETQTFRLAQIEIKGDYPEGAQMPGFFGELRESLADGLARLNRAAEDDSLSGVLLRIDGPSIGWAKLSEFQQAIERIRANGKKVYAWLPSGMTKDYLLAAACDEVVMPESGMLMLLGLRAEVTFYKNLLDLLGVEADMIPVGEFKSAAEPYTRTEMSPEFREQTEAVLDDHYRQLVDAIAAGRQLDPEQVKAAIDSGPHTAKAARELGLIDRIAYEDEIESLIANGDDSIELKLTRAYGKKKPDTDFSGLAGMVKMMNLLMGVESGQRASRRPKVAVIHATGMIMTGRSSSDLFGGQVLGSDTLVRAIRRADEDESVKAIVLRVDSPGGSALASDLIWRALQKVDKPVVASMGDVAASGGYYISMGADAIFAEPGTLTGSIGVVGGKLALKGLFEKVGVTTSVISRGKNSGVLSPFEGFTEDERAAMTKLLHDIYDQFTRKAAEGRKMEVEDLEKLARGRVYTGAMAQKVGLVDKLGTLDDAIAYATRLAGHDPEETLERLVLPRPTSPLEALFGPLDPEARAQAARQAALKTAAEALGPEAAAPLQSLGVIDLLSREPRLTLMPFRLTVR